MIFFSLSLLYFIFLIWFLKLFTIYKISLYTSVYIIYTLLIGIPFFIIFAEIENIFLISNLLNRTIDAKVSLPMNDGLRPIIFLLVFNFIYLLVGSIYMFRFKYIEIRILSLTDSMANKIFRYAKILFIMSLLYIVIRYVFYPDFPLFALLKNGFDDAILRDVAFYYGSNTDLPYIFLPSINSQFFRILIPVSFFIILFYSKNYKSSYTIKLLLFMCLFIVIGLNLGTFKRTPILYLSTWFILYQYMYSNNKSLLKIIKYVVLTIFVLIAITALYTDKEMGVILANLLTRFAIGEAIGEFLAIEHFGTTFDYMYFDIFTVYFQKVLGMDVMTFSELWKILVGGTRGYTSIGVIAEFIVSFGYLSVFYFMFFTVLIIKLDLLFKKYSGTIYRPIIAGLITFISFMMVKGFFAQLFTGGVLTLILVGIVMKTIIKEHNYLNKENKNV